METGKADDGLFAMGARGGTVHHGNDGVFTGVVASRAAIIDGGVRITPILRISLIVVVALILASVTLLVYPKEAGGWGQALKTAELRRGSQVIGTDQAPGGGSPGQAQPGFPLAVLLVLALILIAVLVVVPALQIDLIPHMEIFRVAIARHLIAVAEITVIRLCGQGAELSGDATVAAAIAATAIIVSRPQTLAGPFAGTIPVSRAARACARSLDGIGASVSICPAVGYPNKSRSIARILKRTAFGQGEGHPYQTGTVTHHVVHQWGSRRVRAVP